ncbi:acetylglutamate kinase [Veillonella caviae]|uniref:acetylglutamate kinase n=1 Tax=Veillonella caviae TaxID=248316 RepID=UPI000F8EE810|nr:acetylglutamate kinase [Veillonella caviae]MCI5709480.1 acetylglutamate kinase [Veillonella caviae]MCI6408107.1 acetylglutamate kinase [Veillonella caviae]MDD7290829.1 acetylglutamate kinase [Veillonella caviae]MDY5714556.1 acetylglutamate kinase [Veillonella caviae]MDY6224432.1 acetylglutamate kinase [Veillonella caviae]
MNTVTNAMRAHILTAAVPYIKQYTDKYVVVKYGGNAMTDPELKKSVMNDLLLLQLVGVKVVLVHGGGPDINNALQAMHIESQFKNGLRVTDKDTMDVVQMVLAGKVNKGLVADLISFGGRAVGLCGVDGHMIQVHQKNDELGYVGEVDVIDTAIIDDVISKGYIPVISSIGCGADGQVYNVNADTVAAKIAGALKAETMVAMTNIDGVLRDVNNPSSLIPRITVAEAETLKVEGIIAGGMIPKVDCCLEAIAAGAQKVFIINGEIPHAILIELLTDEGLGTMFVKE